MSTIWSKKSYQQLAVHYDESRQTLWIIMQPHPTPTFTPTLIKSLRLIQEELAVCALDQQEDMPKFIVWCSGIKNIFNLGLDLEHMLLLIKQQDSKSLDRYIHTCLDMLFLNFVNLNLPINNFAYIRGKSYGSGMEFALSSDVMFSDHKALFGYPAVKHDFWPSTEICSIFSERVASFSDLKIIEGAIVNGEFMHELKLTELVYNTDCGYQLINHYIDNIGRHVNKFRFKHRTIKQKLFPTIKENFNQFVKYWQYCLLNTKYSEIEKLYRFVKTQKKICIADDTKNNIIKSCI